MLKQIFGGLACIATILCSADSIPLDKGLVPNPKNPADSFTSQMGATGVLLILKLDKPGIATVSLPLDVVRIAGKEMVFSCWIKFDNISKKTKSYNGVKFMDAYKDENGKMQYPQCNITADSVPWNKFYLRTKFPADLKTAMLVLGLEEVSGIVQFRDLEMNEKQ